MARGPKPVPFTLSPEERAALAALVRAHRTGQALAQRARIVLACGPSPAPRTRAWRRRLGSAAPV